MSLVIFRFKRAVQLQSLIVADSVLQSLRGQWISRSEIGGAINPLPVEIGVHLVNVAPDLGFISSAACVEDADHLPLAFTEFYRVAHVGMCKPPMNTVAHHHFALSWRKPAALGQLHGWPQFQAILHHAADGDVYFAGTIFAGQHDHNCDFARDERFAVTVEAQFSGGVLRRASRIQALI